MVLQRFLLVIDPHLAFFYCFCVSVGKMLTLKRGLDDITISPSTSKRSCNGEETTKSLISGLLSCVCAHTRVFMFLVALFEYLQLCYVCLIR